MDTIIRTPIDHPSAWRSADLLSDESWIVRMEGRDIAELDAALAVAAATGKPVTELARTDFPLDGLRERVAQWSAEVTDGRGFVLVRGLPVDRYTDEQVRTIYWGLGLYWGSAVSQNAYGDLLGEVYDEGVKMGKGVRGYRTNSRLWFHTDRADVVGLLCLHKAMRGGTSRITSSMAIYNEIVRTHPEYLEPLYNGYLYMNVEEGGDSSTWRVPIYSVTDGVLSCRSSRNTIESARRAGVAKYSELETAALEYMDALAEREDLCLNMELVRGDMQFVNNYTTLHARTEYEDPPPPAPRRMMVRLWLKVPRRRPVAGHYREYDGVKKTLERARPQAA